MATTQKKIYTGRAHGHQNIRDGTLILPDITADSTESLTLHGVKVTVLLKDIFEIKNRSVVVIPYFEDGLLFNRMKEINVPPEGTEITYPMAQIAEIPSYVDGISKFILYHYDRSNHRLEEDFERLGEFCQPGDTLVLPTFGTRNQISFYDVASRIFYGLLGCLTIDDSHLRKLTEIIITTIFDNNQDSNSTRVIKHLFNHMTIYEKTANEPECVICRDMRRNVILNCGHRIACARCILDISKSHNVCPVCNTFITFIYPCYTITDMSDQPCACGQDKPKSGHIFVPCGHFNTTCSDCEHQHLDTHQCPVCHEYIMGSVKLYQ